MKTTSPDRAGTETCRVIVVGDTCVSEEGMAAIVGRHKRYQVRGGAHGFFDAGELIRKHQPDVLLIEPFLEDRDGILWIKELATEFPHTRILIVSRQSERIYAERALHAGAAGYWMKNGSAEELMRAVDTVAAGELYASLTITERKKLLETQPLADLHFRLGSEQTKPRFAGLRSGSKSALSLDYVLSRVGKV